MKILIVDDDELAAEMISSILKLEGYDIQIVHNAVDAINVLAINEHFGLVISDLHMPLMNGIDLFREIQQLSNPVPFVLLTGEDPSIIQAQEPDMVNCLHKGEELLDNLVIEVKRFCA